MSQVSRFYRQGSPVFEQCFNVETSAPLTSDELERLRWLLAETFEPDGLSVEPSVNFRVVEIGPRLNFATASSTNALATCHAIGLTKVTRLECSRRFRMLDCDADPKAFAAVRHDRMTEEVYDQPLTSFETGITPEPVFFMPLLEQGPDALRALNQSMGLGMDNWDIDFTLRLFIEDEKRNPTNVECFGIGQANSEHCRHGFFRGRIVINGQVIPRSLLDVVRSTWQANTNNSIIAFHDNSSAIRGYWVETIIPESPGFCSRFVKTKCLYHLIFTAETHNFPCGIAPFPGAETGTGGRIRDVQATGRGAMVIAGTCGFCVGNLHIPGYVIPGEPLEPWDYPPNMARPLTILLQESAGAWDYGNKFGEPVILGFTRTFGLRLSNGERREWIKPIMFTGGIGQIDDRHVTKDEAKAGMLIVQIGGPAYRIGRGGGAASSMIQGANKADLDFDAVQRGDAQMENKMDRVVRACIAMGDRNPIRVLHDQGAGGPCNVLTELVNPAGGKIYIRRIKLGDATLAVIDIWGAEYQERLALLIWPDRIEEFKAICRREKINCEVLGEITGNGRIVVYDDNDGSTPVDLDLKKILGDVPRKTFEFTRPAQNLMPLRLTASTFPNVREALRDVFKLLSVGSKEGLLNRVDRSVSGLVVRQQYCGPAQLPVADAAVVAQSHFSQTGGALAIGEQPVKMLVNSEAGARMAVAEMLTNIIGVRLSGLTDISSSANWMWAAKQEGEGALLYDAALAAEALMIELGIKIDGGKDSLSMAAKVLNKLVKAPGELVISGYCTVLDITKVVTPDLKYPGQSKLLYLDFTSGHKCLGGSALAQTLGEIGDDCPEVDARILRSVFEAVQRLVDRGLISAIHDRSDGGLITALLEMAFAGNCGLDLNFRGSPDVGLNVIKTLFNEELGLVMEFLPKNYSAIAGILRRARLNHFCQVIGRTVKEDAVDIRFQGSSVLKAPMTELRADWRETSFQLASLQANSQMVTVEKTSTLPIANPVYNLTWSPRPTSQSRLTRRCKPQLAILREEGTNGDREMASAFFLAGFEPVDMTMTDLIDGQVSLKDVQGLVAPGGFSFADVFGAGKGWAAVFKFNARVADESEAFFDRKDTFGLFVCNGCQLAPLLGIVPYGGIASVDQPRFIRNASGVFESRFVTVEIAAKTNSIFLQGMEGSRLGVWVAHGEGRFFWPDDSVRRKLMDYGLAPIRYVLPKGGITEAYPFNPNGSPDGVAALSSINGRFLAMMPHPERLFQRWQWPYWPPAWHNLKASPWLRLFQNAYDFAVNS